MTEFRLESNSQVLEKSKPNFTHLFKDSLSIFFITDLTILLGVFSCISHDVAPNLYKAVKQN